MTQFIALLLMDVREIIEERGRFGAALRIIPTVGLFVAGVAIFVGVCLL